MRGGISACKLSVLRCTTRQADRRIDGMWRSTVRTISDDDAPPKPRRGGPDARGLLLVGCRQSLSGPMVSKQAAISTRDAPGTDDPRPGAFAGRGAHNFATVDDPPPPVSGAHLLGSLRVASDLAAVADHPDPPARRAASDPATTPRYASPRLDELWDVAGSAAAARLSSGPGSAATDGQAVGRRRRASTALSTPPRQAGRPAGGTVPRREPTEIRMLVLMR